MTGADGHERPCGFSLAALAPIPPVFTTIEGVVHDDALFLQRIWLAMSFVSGLAALCKDPSPGAMLNRGRDHWTSASVAFLKKRFDRLHGVSLSVRSPWTITSFNNQHGKKMYRVECAPSPCIPPPYLTHA